MGNKGGETDGR